MYFLSKVHNASKFESDTTLSITICTGNTVRVEKKELCLPTLLEELLPLAYSWHNIGTILGIPEGELNKIKRDNFNQSDDCLREMISKWLKMIDPEPTWDRLVNAVEKINEKKKAQDIKSKYLT